MEGQKEKGLRLEEKCDAETEQKDRLRKKRYR
jgi:hypothetical protein